MSLELWTLTLAVLTAIVCALCGTLLVVKREAMVAEGIAHAVLPGIIIAFIFLRDRSSPLLILSAAGTGLMMVLVVSALRRTGMVENDASLGIVFSAMFSVGVLMASQNLRNSDFHANCIIDGNLALAPLDTLKVNGATLGPRSFYVILVVLLLLVAYLTVFFKELTLAVFDETLADSFGLRPVALHTLWLALVSIAIVSTFEIAGSVLVVAMIIAPAAGASLLVNRLDRMLFTSVALGVLSAVGGFYLSLQLDISPTGPISSVAGLVFLLVLLFASNRGLVSRLMRRFEQRRQMSSQLLLEHLMIAQNNRSEVTAPQIAEHFAWTPRQAEKVVGAAISSGLVVRTGAQLAITGPGREELRASTGDC